MLTSLNNSIYICNVVAASIVVIDVVCVDIGVIVIACVVDISFLYVLLFFSKTSPSQQMVSADAQAQEGCVYHHGHVDKQKYPKHA